jgi:phosphatidylserine/phosphatidylglycerophosphate/cardiolipin synthase-like enzyme
VKRGSARDVAARTALALGVLGACAALGACARAPAPAAPKDGGFCGGAVPAEASTAPELTTLAESWPEETTLDHADVPDADEVWRDMIAGAREAIDFAEFYASEAEPPWLATSKLRKVIAEIAAAVTRGVRVRFLVDASFAAKYPDTLLALERAGVLVRRFDVAKTMGGVLHAKYFVVDRRDGFVGSQNFDWRALGHIQEIGVRHRGRESVVLAAIFASDWALAAGEAPPDSANALCGRRPARAPDPDGRAVRTVNGREVVLAASPEAFLPPGVAWDLPELVAMIGAARKSVVVQVLTYGTHDRDGGRFTPLDDALRAAAARGVAVRVLVSHWAVKPGSRSREALVSLSAAGGDAHVEVRVLTIPPWSGGDIPFARVAHAKYAVVDGDARAWVGTSNWEGDYFRKSRNVSVFLPPGELPAKLARVFASGWTSAYATRLGAGEPATVTRTPQAAASSASSWLAEPRSRTW